MRFRDYLRDLRIKENKTQADFAKELDVSLDAIKKIETGQTKIPSRKLLKSLATYLGQTEPIILQNFLFEDKVYEIPEAWDKPLVFTGLNYLAYMYLQGWNITSTFSSKKEGLFGDDLHIGEITKKVDPKYNLRVDHIGLYYLDERRIYSDPDYAMQIMFSFCKVAHDLVKEYKETHVIFSVYDSSQFSHYKYLKSYAKPILKSPIHFVLYDYKNSKVLDQYRFM